jgi:MoxR-like ATPase
MTTDKSIEQQAAEFASRYQAVRAQLGRVIVGHGDVLDGVLTCLFVGGHCLLEGVPGLGKTLLVRTLAETLDLKFSRIQFTPDLMPADILGTNMVLERPDGGREFQFQKGPIFTQICLADEINRATPKTQSAMLETMQERRVSIAGKTFAMQLPFFVMATQNPLEQEGTYPLPEAQLDRFFFKLLVGYSSREELSEIVDRTTRGVETVPEKVMDGAEILQWQQLVRQVIVAPHVQDYIVRLTLATHPGSQFALPEATQYLRWGASPRGAQTIALASKTRALLHRRYNVSFEDVRRCYLPAMRHRVILNFEAQAEGVEADALLAKILERVPEKEAVG